MLKLIQLTAVKNFCECCYGRCAASMRLAVCLALGGRAGVVVAVGAVVVPGVRAGFASGFGAVVVSSALLPSACSGARG